MNYLAHIYLSEDHIEYQLGNLLADPLKGKAWPECSSLFLEGMQMHKEIDKFTDKHALFKRSKARLGHRGYLRGVVIDVVYDYMLCKNWDDYNQIALPTFINRFHQAANLQIQNYPEKPKKFISKLIKHRALSAYSSVEGLGLTFQRIDKRLSKRIKAKESMKDYMDTVIVQLDKIEDDFNEFFPNLVSFVKQNQ